MISRATEICRHVFAQFGKLWPILLILYGLIVLILIVAASQSVVPVDVLFREPYSIGHIPSYVGVLSNAGAFMWCCTIAICLFTHRAVRRLGVLSSHANLLMIVAAFTFVLLLDDVLMLHERVAGPLLPNGQLVTYVVYAVAVLGFLVRYRTVLLKSEYSLLLLASGLLGGSAALDALKEVFSIQPVPSAYHVVVEDGLKLSGIATWLLYYSRFCFQLIDESVLGPNGDTTSV